MSGPLTDERLAEIRERYAAVLELMTLGGGNDSMPVARYARDIKKLLYAVEAYRPIVEAVAEYDNINPWGKAQFICGICEGTAEEDEFGIIDADSAIIHAPECPVHLARVALGLPEVATDNGDEGGVE